MFLTIIKLVNVNELVELCRNLYLLTVTSLYCTVEIFAVQAQAVTGDASSGQKPGEALQSSGKF